MGKHELGKIKSPLTMFSNLRFQTTESESIQTTQSCWSPDKITRNSIMREFSNWDKNVFR